MTARGAEPGAGWELWLTRDGAEAGCWRRGGLLRRMREAAPKNGNENGKGDGQEPAGDPDPHLTVETQNRNANQEISAFKPASSRYLCQSPRRKLRAMDVLPSERMIRCQRIRLARMGKP